MTLVSTHDDRLKLEKTGEGVYAVTDADVKLSEFTDVSLAYKKLCEQAQQAGYRVSEDFVFHVKK